MSKEVGMSSCCLSGKVHDGKPTGRVDELGGIQTYIAEPKSGSKEKTIIFISDIFGWEFPNTRLLADEYAKQGNYYCYIPDLHSGDSLDISFLQNVEPPLKDQAQLSLTDKATNAALVPATLGPWLAKHREGVTRPLLDGFVNTVRMIPGTDRIGALGFCWGGRYAILQAHGQQKTGEGSSIGGVDVAVACHPSLVSVPGDFEGVAKPLCLAVGDKDSLLDMESVKKIREVLEEKKDVPHEVRIYEDQIHGFALRSDWSSEKDKKAMDEAAQQGMAWFGKHL